LLRDLRQAANGTQVGLKGGGFIRRCTDRQLNRILAIALLRVPDREADAVAAIVANEFDGGFEFGRTQVSFWRGAADCFAHGTSTKIPFLPQRTSLLVLQRSFRRKLDRLIERRMKAGLGFGDST
jgi:hypothetical protein